MNLENCYQKTPECLAENMDGEILLYNPVSVTTFHLNGSSSIVWELCNGMNTASDMIDALQQQYPSQHEQIENDVIVALTELVKNGVIVKVVS